jgi:hypothetical protein
VSIAADRRQHWATQSGVTDPGLAAAAIDALPSDIAALCKASSQLVFHYRAGDGLRVPPVVTSFDPMGGPPRQVDVSRTLGSR